MRARGVSRGSVVERSGWGGRKEEQGGIGEGQQRACVGGGGGREMVASLPHSSTMAGHFTHSFVL